MQSASIFKNPIFHEFIFLIFLKSFSIPYSIPLSFRDHRAYPVASCFTAQISCQFTSRSLPATEGGDNRKDDDFVNLR
ncbi:hypothetical protein CFR74_01620 [Novacetimonas hansenii]|nr:hypothetical protein CFR74_01620 [Novacetimonas hansenii]